MSSQINWQDVPPNTNQAVLWPFQPDFNYIETFPCNECYDLPLYLLDDQILFDSVCTSYDAVSLPLENSGWLEDVALDCPAMATEEQLLQLQSAIEERSTEPEHSSESQALKQDITRLKTKCDRLEGVIEKLENEIEEKTKFVVGVEDYISKLMAWTVEFNQAAESLAEDILKIKEAINLSKS